ncbi:MAG: SMP-30/gluconolactonase/LRE family protein [Gluconacetobacter diazotrophicus]|nr:SMP-30/gluconolactonase/LRE family protein [Gluconacetobacter diazotrophicus]
MARSLFATGVGAPEGPVALPDGSLLVTEMAGHRLRITRLTPEGHHHPVFVTNGRPNGLTTDGDGNMWIAEAGHRALLCVSPEGREILRLQGDADGPFLFPNDLCFGPDGNLWMTDSGYPLTEFLDGQSFVDNYLDLPWDGRVYEIDPRAGKVLRRIDSGIRFTNGIAFDANDVLYANASFTGDVYRYEVHGTRAPKRELFGNVLQPTDAPGCAGEFQGPDGMCFGDDGRLYCTVYGQTNITVLDRDGTVAERLALDGPNPTNCAFALEGRTLYVTEAGVGQVEALDVPCGGLPLHRPKLGRR